MHHGVIRALTPLSACRALKGNGQRAHVTLEAEGNRWRLERRAQMAGLRMRIAIVALCCFFVVCHF